MKVLHLVSGNRWTGAAAPAFAEVEALRAEGIEAHYAYVGGYKLEAKIGHLDFAHAIIEKSQNPAAFLRSAATVRALMARHGIEIVHAHLTYDHWLARFAVSRPAIVARTFHTERVLRRDPLTRLLVRGTRGVFVVNDSFRNATALGGRIPVFTPPPVDRRQFRPDGPDLSVKYGLDSASPRVVAIGKLSAGRGFEAVLRSFALIRRANAAARLMIVGHGEHRAALERLTSELGLTPQVVWAGYHEEDLAEHYRSADLMLFTAAGSDAGHRAVLEAMSCGVVPVVAPLAGMDALLGGFPRLIAADPSAEAIAACANDVWRSGAPLVREELLRHSRSFGYEPAATRLRTAYEMLM